MQRQLQHQEIQTLCNTMEDIGIKKLQSGKIDDHKFLYQQEVVEKAQKHAKGDIDKFVSYVKERLPDVDIRELM